MVADRFASNIYTLWLEEAINKGELPIPKNAPNFYEGLSREAYSKCTWIGQGRGQIDELKETQAAILRIKSGLSTYEKECARFGDDYRETFEQKARENGIMKKLHIVTDLETNPASKGRPAAEAPTDDPTDDQGDNNE